MYILIALCGPAGSGKDTIVHTIIQRYPERFHEIVTCTSRSPREGEKEGINYFYLTDEQFHAKVANGEMLEWDCFNSWYYGTVINSLVSDKINIGVWTLNGISKFIANKNLKVLPFFVQVDDKERLLRQLNREAHPNVAEIVRRFGADANDFRRERLQEFDLNYLINTQKSDLEVCVKTIVDKSNLLISENFDI